MAADIVIGSRSSGAGTKLHKTLVMTDRTALAFTASSTENSFTINANAFTHTIILETPDFTNAVTSTLSIENSNSVELYSESGLAENTDHIMFAKRPLVGDNTVKVTLSGVAGGSGGTAYVTLYLTGE